MTVWKQFLRIVWLQEKICIMFRHGVRYIRIAASFGLGSIYI